MPFQTSYSYLAPTQLQVGRGTISVIPELATSRGLKKPLIVTDRGLVQAGIVSRVTEVMDAAGVNFAIYDDVAPNPPIACVDACLDAYRTGGCDWLLAVGGGSSMDTAKCAGVLASNGGRIQDYFGIGKVGARVPFLVCVPTTYGTASEVTPFAVITDDAQFKAAVGGPEIIPDVGVLDADLAVALPMPVAAATGMDALTHAIESYVALTSNALSEAPALHAIRLIGDNLRQAASSDHNHEATENMLVASTLAGIAFSQTRLGNVHAMSHPVSGHFGVPHGVANAVLLTRIMDFNLVACPDRFAEIAAALGEDTDGLTEMEAAQVSVEAVETLAEDVGIPADLEEAGADAQGIPRMAEDAMKSGNIQINPRKTTLQDVIDIYESAF